MAQQKIQMEVGSNLPPLKNDLINEKKKELEEYQVLKQMKAKYREEKRLLKMQEKINKKKPKSINASPDRSYLQQQQALENPSLNINAEIVSEFSKIDLNLNPEHLESHY